MVPLALERQRGETQLRVKEVKIGNDRYIVGRNDAGREGQADRQAIIAGSRHSARRATSHWSATRPTGLTSRPAARTPRSMSARKMALQTPLADQRWKRL